MGLSLGIAKLIQINIPGGLCSQCSCSHVGLQPTPPPQETQDPSAGLDRVPMEVLFCAGSQCTETLFALEEWSPSPSPVEFCTQAALTFKAKYPEGSSFQCLTLRLSWGPVFKWKYPCVACAGFILFVFTFWWRARFSMNDCYFFVQCPRVVIPLMEGVPAVTRACTRC